MHKSIALIAAIALASTVSADPLFYTAPVAATSWTAGSKATVSWNNDCATFTGNKTLPITLYQSSLGLQVQVPGTSVIGYVDCTSAGSTQVMVPSVATGNTYSILVTAAEQSFSALFTIINPNNTALPSTSASATSSPLPSSTVANTTASTNSTASVTASPTATKTSGASALQAGSMAAFAAVAVIANLVL